MRLWSIHPKYLDRQGLGALWRKAQRRGYHYDLRRIAGRPAVADWERGTGP
jgi:pyrimidine dimer DNA glycosylase